MTRINIAAAIMLALPMGLAAQDGSRYVLAEVVAVEPIHEVISTPVSSRTCWEEPVYETVYAEPEPYYGRSYGPSYAIGISSGHHRGRGYGHGGGHHRGHGGHTSYAFGYSGGGYGYPGGAGERVLGAVAGGLLGNQIGSGSGKAAATFFGAVLGDALVADSQARRYAGYAPAPTARTVVSYRERCREQTIYRREQQAQWFDVTYRWGGELYHTRTGFDPGDRIRVRVDVTSSQ
ncbi:MAG: hypothetical protein CVV14_02775 [Gammaproteobacteria bacterium HGW-Gammaproteobacteria-4]|jgi:uncharacterized protein YcfJ|nr:MAG: hypothetical protein CVV14_02775 [Gammaproteobacteria bacterium HGW-Gammaproteobacteria-4]